jgi:hypothetical protein
MTHEEASEIVLGLMYRKAATPKAARPEMFVFPYDHAVKMLQGGVTNLDRIRAECGNVSVDAPLAATEHVKMSGVNWLSILERKYNNAQLVAALREEAEKVEGGRDADAKRIHAALMQTDSDHRAGIRLDTVPDDDDPYIPTGLPWLDEHLGGLPGQGLIVITAPPKAGKTSLGIQFCGAFAEDKRESALYSLEMTEREIARRARELCVPKKYQRHITIVRDLYSADEIAYHISREQWVRASRGDAPLELAVVDFMDMMIEEETTEASTAQVYKDLSKVAKVEGLPIILFAQPNRSYVGGIVRPNHTRYSGMAEAMGKVLMSEYNPNTDFTGQIRDNELPPHAGRAYICLWACREGFRIHRRDNPGAVQVAWDGELAWGKKALGWFKLSSFDAPRRERDNRRNER